MSIRDWDLGTSSGTRLTGAGADGTAGAGAGPTFSGKRGQGSAAVAGGRGRNRVGILTRGSTLDLTACSILTLSMLLVSLTVSRLSASRSRSWRMLLELLELLPTAVLISDS